MKRLLDWIEKALEATLVTGLVIMATVIAVCLSPLRKLKKWEAEQESMEMDPDYRPGEGEQRDR